MDRKCKVLYVISTSYFYCGILTSSKDIVVKAAPIVKYMVGWKISRVYSYCKKRKFTIEKEG